MHFLIPRHFFFAFAVPSFFGLGSCMTLFRLPLFACFPLLAALNATRHARAKCKMFDSESSIIHACIACARFHVFAAAFFFCLAFFFWGWINAFCRDGARIHCHVHM